jgi:ribonuclease HI
MGSRLLARREAWRRIKGEKLLLRGVRVEWKDAGSVARLARDFALHPHHTPKQHRAKYAELLGEELSEGVVREVPLQEAKWLNPTFLVPKAGNKFRKILDCRRLNEEMRDRHFKMESAEDVLQLARPGDWATSLDFRSAFNHISVDVGLRPYLCFLFAGRCYQYQAMPFGLKQAPRTFTRLMKRAVTAVRERWRVRMIFYMDDSLLLFPSQEQARQQTREIADFFEDLGWTLSPDKCQLEPLQVIDFLGWRWNLAGGFLTTTPRRRQALIGEVKSLLQLCSDRARMPTRKLASVLGGLNFLRLQMRDASLHTLTLDTLKVRAVRAGGWEGYTQMTPQAQGDLKWWIQQLTRNAPRQWLAPSQKAMITTDASPVGWGAVLSMDGERSFAYGRWTVLQRAMTSNAKELTAVRMALLSWRAQLEAVAPATVAVQSDNTTTVHLINNRRAAATLAMHLRRLLWCCKRMRLELVATYLPGVQNDTADRLSRVSGLTGYHLKPEVLRGLLTEAEFQPTLDVFGREPELSQQATAEEAAASEQRGPAEYMRMEWAGQHLFLHPPLNRIAAVLRRLQAEPTPALIITPAWKSQPWSPILAELTEKQVHLGAFEEAMQTTAEFQEAGWRLPPGNVVGTTLGTRTMRAVPCSSGC